MAARADQAAGCPEADPARRAALMLHHGATRRAVPERGADEQVGLARLPVAGTRPRFRVRDWVPVHARGALPDRNLQPPGDVLPAEELVKANHKDHAPPVGSGYEPV